MEDIIISKVLTEVGVFNEVLYADQVTPRIIKTIVVNNNNTSNSAIDLILSLSEDSISNRDYLQTEEVEPGTTYINLNIKLSTKQYLFVKSSLPLVITVIGNG